MTFFQFDAPQPGESYEYPSLGFTAEDGAILDGTASDPVITNAPGPEWSVVASGPESGITRYAQPSFDPDFVEPADGSLLSYSDSGNHGGWTSPADLVDSSHPFGQTLKTAIAGQVNSDDHAPLGAWRFDNSPTVGGVQVAHIPMLVPNHRFDTAVPLNDTTTTTNWRQVDGNIVKVIAVDDGPSGPQNVLQFVGTTNLAYVKIDTLKARGLAGKTVRVTVTVRALVNGDIDVVVPRVTVQDAASTATLNTTTFFPPVPTDWTTVTTDVAIPAATDAVYLYVGCKTSGGSGRCQFADVLFNLPGPLLSAVKENLLDPRTARSLPSEAISQAKAGVVGTSGRVPIALRFDDDQDFIKSYGLPVELRDRGLPWSEVWSSQLGSNPWNDEVTYTDLTDWNRNYGAEVWSHGTNHKSPWSADYDTFLANVHREIVQSKADIEALGDVRVMGYAMPGVPDPGYGFAAPNRLTTFEDYNSEVGQMLMQTYGVVETDITGYYRQLPSALRYGLSHLTVSDGVTLTEAENYIDGAINLGHGLELMCHTGMLGQTGNIAYADLLTILDYLVTKRDAGLIEVVAPSSLPFCDPASSRRLDLISNGDFSTTVEVNNFTVWGNWRSVDGTHSLVANVADGHGGSAADVLRTDVSSTAYQSHPQCVGRGLAGQSYMLDAWVRAVSGTPNWRLRVTNPDIDFAGTVDVQGPTTAEWAHVRRCFAMPPTLDTLALFFSAATAGSVEWSDVHVWVA